MRSVRRCSVGGTRDDDDSRGTYENTWDDESRRMRTPCIPGLIRKGSMSDTFERSFQSVSTNY